ncbi:profilin [Xylaria sp. CBS 124048]|nr:profilin [Xylaria sp. CBS 124048]
MSWQAYIDTSLVGTGHIDKAAIVSSAGDSVWAASADFTIQPAELKTITSILKGDKATIDKGYAEGLYVAGERYVLTRCDEDFMYARQGQTGVCVALTRQTFIVAHHSKDQIAGNASTTTKALADYFKNLGY